MDGLLAKAGIFRKLSPTRTVESTNTDLAAHKEAEIMAEMDSILENSRLEITESTLAFSARSSGILFPVLTNFGALFLLLVLGTFFFLRLNQDEISLVTRSSQLSSAEGLIIEALREASELELSKKENQIASIQSMLRAAEESRAVLISELNHERTRLQEELKAELNQELERERQRLLALGLGSTLVSSQLAVFETQKQDELQSRLAALNVDFDRQLEARAMQFDRQLEEYRRTLEQARSEQESIRGALERQLAKTRQESMQELGSMEAQRTAAMKELENLGRLQENARLIEGRILSLYDSVNMHLRQTDFQLALAELDRLESFLGTPEARRVPSVAERLNVELFLVNSLRSLIHKELAPRDAGPESRAPNLARQVLDKVTSRVEEGNRLYATGSFEAAKAEYLAALAEIPQLEEGYTRLQDLADKQLAEKRSLLDRQLAEATQLYQSNQYQASVEKYRQALVLMENGVPRFSSTLNELIDAGYRLRKSMEPPPPPIIVREELSPRDRELVQRARAADSRRWTLLDALDRLRTRYAPGPGELYYASAQENMVLLLNTKLLIRRALLEKGIREEYPELYETLDLVFAAYGSEQRQAGRIETLQEVITITDFLNDDRGNHSLPTLASWEDLRQRTLLLEFLGNLQRLLEPRGGHPEDDF